MSLPDPSIFTSVINGYLPEPHASLLNGILFGINLKSGKTFYEELKIVGLLHLVVLSGINITMLASITGSLTNFLGKRMSILLTILIIILFILFVGPQAPIIRAGIMGILTFVATLYGRKNYALYAFFLSLIFIAIIWPSWLTTVSLQLSYGVTLGIILFGSFQERKSKKLSQIVKNTVMKDLKPSLAAQFFTVPIIFIYFKQVSLVAPLSNLLVAWTIYPLMIFGFLTAILGKIHFVFGIIPSYICYGLLSYMVFIIDVLSRLPLVYFKF